mmetsp:Transcript_3157/g.5473  ORF Transcript_3157/g.5473 Transcript_3157/m.5473 type:complete len:91 (-) Transcript_3157:726-998(-)
MPGDLFLYFQQPEDCADGDDDLALLDIADAGVLPDNQPPARKTEGSWAVQASLMSRHLPLLVLRLCLGAPHRPRDWSLTPASEWAEKPAA